MNDVLDRLISGAGAVSDGADRAVRLLTGGWRGGTATSVRPGSVIVAMLLLVVAGLLLVAGIEATDPATPAVLDPAAVSVANDLPERTYSTMHGSLLSTFVATFEDLDGDGTLDVREKATAWDYWLVDPLVRRGVTVRSTRPPSALFTYKGPGVVIDDPGYNVQKNAALVDEQGAAGLLMDPTTVIDATRAVGATVPLDLATALPGAGTAVEVSGARLGNYIAMCSHDADRDKICDDDEVDRFEFVVFDPASKRAVRVHLREPPEFSETTITGLLRREERVVDDARSAQGFDFLAFDVAISDRYLLDDAAPPGSAPLAFVLAFGLAGLAGVLLVGVAGGYLIYRRSAGPLPAPVTSLGAGERLPLRISGIVRTPTGLEHVREVPGELIRFVLGRPVAPVGPAEAGEAVPAWPSDGPPDEVPEATTLIVERVGHPHGVAVGLGELDRVSAGRVMTFRAPRPALRLVAGTGTLLLSFETSAERDRAAAELLDETGLGPDGARIQTT